MTKRKPKNDVERLLYEAWGGSSNDQRAWSEVREYRRHCGNISDEWRAEMINRGVMQWANTHFYLQGRIRSDGTHVWAKDLKKEMAECDERAEAYRVRRASR